MSRNVRDLRDLICVSRLTVRESDDEMFSSDEDSTPPFARKLSKSSLETSSSNKPASDIRRNSTASPDSGFGKASITHNDIHRHNACRCYIWNCRDKQSVATGRSNGSRNITLFKFYRNRTETALEGKHCQIPNVFTISIIRDLMSINIFYCLGSAIRPSSGTSSEEEKDEVEICGFSQSGNCWDT